MFPNGYKHIVAMNVTDKNGTHGLKLAFYIGYRLQLQKGFFWHYVRGDNKISSFELAMSNKIFMYKARPLKP